VAKAHDFRKTDDGDNCHVLHGGKRFSASDPVADPPPRVFLGDGDAGMPVSVEGVGFKVKRPENRPWAALTRPMTTAIGWFQRGQCGIVFQASRMSGDSYKISVHFGTVSALDVTGKVSAPLSAQAGPFWTLRRVTVTRHLRKGPLVTG